MGTFRLVHLLAQCNELDGITPSIDLSGEVTS